MPKASKGIHSWRCSVILRPEPECDRSALAIHMCDQGPLMPKISHFNSHVINSMLYEIRWLSFECFGLRAWYSKVAESYFSAGS